MLNSLDNLLRHLAAALAERRRRRRAFEELSALDDRSLADIGISRSEIAYLLSHSMPADAPGEAAAPVGPRFRHA